MVVDTQGTIVARSYQPEQFVGTRVKDSFLQRMRESDEGLFHDVARDGTKVYVAYSHEPSSGWTTAVVVPAEVAESSARSKTLAVLGIGFALLALSTFGAFVISRHVRRGLLAAAEAAETMSRGRRPQALTSSVKEVAQLGRALNDSAALLAQHEQERDEQLARATAARAEAETARRAQEGLLRDLRESEARLQLVADHAPVLITYCGADRRYRFVNEPYAERFRMRPVGAGRPLRRGGRGAGGLRRHRALHGGGARRRAPGVRDRNPLRAARPTPHVGRLRAGVRRRRGRDRLRQRHSRHHRAQAGGGGAARVGGALRQSLRVEPARAHHHLFEDGTPARSQRDLRAAVGLHARGGGRPHDAGAGPVGRARRPRGGAGHGRAARPHTRRGVPLPHEGRQGVDGDALGRADRDRRRALRADGHRGRDRAQARRGRARPDVGAREDAARRGREGEPLEGRVPRDRLARAAHASDGDPRLVAHARNGRHRREDRAPRRRRHPAQRAPAAADRRRHPRRVARHHGQAAA